MKAFVPALGLILALCATLGWANARASPDSTKTVVSPSPIFFDTPEKAQSHCPKDIVVWLDKETGKFHVSGETAYGNTTPGTYVCATEAIIAGYQNADPVYKELSHQFVTNFCAVYDPPVSDSNCKPITNVTYYNGYIVKIESIVACGPEYEQALIRALKSTVFPVVPSGLKDHLIVATVGGLNMDKSKGQKKPCKIWKKPVVEK